MCGYEYKLKLAFHAGSHVGTYVHYALRMYKEPFVVSCRLGAHCHPFYMEPLIQIESGLVS